MNKYSEHANKYAYITTYKNHRIAVVVAEQYRSSLGDYISTKRPDIDFVLIINLERMSISLRCRNDRVDLSQICKEFHHEAGGHKRAAGFPIDEETMPKIKKYIKGYFRNINKIK